MDPNRFDVLARAAGSARSRRAALLAIAGAALAPSTVAGATPGQEACVVVGKPCKRNTQCCSSRCDGKPGKKTCRTGAPDACLRNGRGCNEGRQCCSGLCARAANGEKRCKASAGQSICQISDDICAQPSGSPAVDCGVGSLKCNCFVTASGQAFCSDGQSTNVTCEDDVTCVAAIGQGARCVTQRTGRCNNGEPVSLCQRPCADPIQTGK